MNTLSSSQLKYLRRNLNRDNGPRVTTPNNHVRLELGKARTRSSYAAEYVQQWIYREFITMKISSEVKSKSTFL